MGREIYVEFLCFLLREPELVLRKSIKRTSKDICLILYSGELTKPLPPKITHVFLSNPPQQFPSKYTSILNMPLGKLY